MANSYEKLCEHDNIVLGDVIVLKNDKAAPSKYVRIPSYYLYTYDSDIIGVCCGILPDNKILVTSDGIIDVNVTGNIAIGDELTIDEHTGKAAAIPYVHQDKTVFNIKNIGKVIGLYKDKSKAKVLLNKEELKMIVTAPPFVRGDSYLFKVKVKHKDGDTPLQPLDVDTIFVTFKDSTAREAKVIFQKTLEDIYIDEGGYCHIIFNPSDTQELDYGKYYFDIEITLTNGYRKTQTYSVRLTEEVTNH